MWAYMFSEIAAIYPITPSSNMQKMSMNGAAFGLKNISVRLSKSSKCQSEECSRSGYQGVCRQVPDNYFYCFTGLLLMIPKHGTRSRRILPGFFMFLHEGLAASISQFLGDHSDVMSVRTYRFCSFATGAFRKYMDIAGVAHLTAIKIKSLPFYISLMVSALPMKYKKWKLQPKTKMAKLLDYKALQEFRSCTPSLNIPVTRGTAQNPDIYVPDKRSCQ